MRPPTGFVLLLTLLQAGVYALSAPSGLSMTSVNMRHSLSWLPLQDDCSTTMLYSVQYQGDFERLVLGGVWIQAPHCQLSSECSCDLSAEVESDSDYNLRVQAQCGPVLSPWQQLHPPFNRNHMQLLPPRLELNVSGDSLLVSLDDVPLICSVRVSLWRTTLKQVVSPVFVEERVVRSSQVRFADLQEGEEYCVQAQSELPSGRSSSSTAPHCDRLPGPRGWEKPVTVAVVALVSTGFLCAVLWFMVHCWPHICVGFFHKEALPQSLEDWPESVQPQVAPQETVALVKVIADVANRILQFEPNGLKYEKAKEWKIPCVNAQWLCDVLLGNFEALRQIQHSRYQNYSHTEPLAPNPQLVINLLEPTLEPTVERAGKFFYLTPGICPSLSTMKAILESAGGKLLPKLPSSKKVQEHTQNKVKA
uniref:Uncharacterized protein n=1 Tax=Knipowitschia caucasica TaxID=637954 RepID=A0AAV2JX88_KNICA